MASDNLPFIQIEIDSIDKVAFNFGVDQIALVSALKSPDNDNQRGSKFITARSLRRKQKPVIYEKVAVVQFPIPDDGAGTATAKKQSDDGIHLPMFSRRITDINAAFTINLIEKSTVEQQYPELLLEQSLRKSDDDPKKKIDQSKMSSLLDQASFSWTQNLQYLCLASTRRMNSDNPIRYDLRNQANADNVPFYLKIKLSIEEGHTEYLEKYILPIGKESDTKGIDTKELRGNVRYKSIHRRAHLFKKLEQTNIKNRTKCSVCKKNNSTRACTICEIQVCSEECIRLVFQLCTNDQGGFFEGNDELDNVVIKYDHALGEPQVNYFGALAGLTCQASRKTIGFMQEFTTCCNQDCQKVYAVGEKPGNMCGIDEDILHKLFKDTINDMDNRPGLPIGYEEIVENVKKRLSRIGSDAKAPKITQVVKFEKLIGKGSYGEVYLSKYIVSDKYKKNCVAVKCVSKKLIIEERLMQDISFEKRALKELDHPFLIKSFQTLGDLKYCYFITEFCAGGDLYNFMNELKRIEEKVFKQYGLEVLLGLNYLHKKKILYRDVKLENVMIGTNGRIRIIDFGMAKFNHGAGDLATTHCGSPPYMAPEIVDSPSRYSFGVDVWAWGVLMFEAITGHLPFNAGTVDDMTQKILFEKPNWRKAPKEVMSKQLKGLLESHVLIKSPEDRLTIEKIFDHDYFKKDFPDLKAVEGKNFPPAGIVPANNLKVYLKNFTTLPDSDKDSVDPISTEDNNRKFKDFNWVDKSRFEVN